MTAQWSIDRARGRATLVITPFRALTPAEISDIESEGAGVLAFAAADQGEHDVRVLDSGG